jgi:NAD+ kinase
MRRTLIVWCTSGPYHVPTLARVALFPIHLDPPTRQHRELFRLLLGAPDLATPSRSLQASASGLPAVTATSAPSPPPSSPSAGSCGSVASGARGRLHNFLQRSKDGASQKGSAAPLMEEGVPPASNATAAGATSSAAAVPNFSNEDPISCGGSSPFWYMEAFAKSLREDSQLAPFDDIILIPNTRGPVSLRQSTHLAALAVLATRGLPHVHVDFTALEHPDESMPIIYELVCKYTNSVLVHWLQDAYEMQKWSHFADFKNTVPMLLLQTQSYPPRALERQRPLGSVSQLTSRQYHSPIGPYVRSPEEAEYYRNAERFIQASMTMRRRNPSPMALTAGDGYLDADMRERYESASLVSRESDYFDDVPDIPPNRRRADKTTPSSSAEAIWQDTFVITRSTPPPTRDASIRHHRGGSVNSRNSISGSGSDGLQRSSAAGHDRLGLSYADCAKGRWWNTPGGRGDDEVELSRAYWSSTSSSWLGGGGAGTAPSLPEWMEEVGATTITSRHRGHRRPSDDRAATESGNDPAVSEGTKMGQHDGAAADGIPEGDRDAVSLDTVVSDDGFALAIDTPLPPRETTIAATTATTTADGKSGVAPPLAQPNTQTSTGEAKRIAAAREHADEDTRKRLLTREIEEVRRMLDGMLRPTSGASTPSTSASPADDGSAAVGRACNTSFFSPSSSLSPHEAAKGRDAAGKAASAQMRASGHAFGAYEAHHSEPHSPTRRRHSSVRQLIEELFPPRAHGPATLPNTAPAAIGMMADGICEYYSEGGNSGNSSRPLSSTSMLNTAVRTTPTHLGFMQHGAASRGNFGDASSGGVGDGNGNASLYSWVDSPMVEVHPITRCTGADVRQALWEQEIHPSSILMDCVQRYMEGHGLYRDPRKATAASLYAGVGANDFAGFARGAAGGVGGPGGQLGAAAEVAGGFRDPTAAGNGSAGSVGSGGNALGNTIMDGRTGARRVAPRDTATLSFPGLIPRLELHYDRNNLLAREQYEKLRLFQCQDGEEPDLIVPIGGDGYMMHCIRKNWRRFIPFYGVNAGHVGYLLNDRSTLEELFSSPLKLHFTTMLYCQAEKEGDMGERMLLSELAFNDAWVERSSGQTALIRILVNGQERIRRLRGDGVLVSTAAGSTAYSQALGASPVPVGAPLIQVVGSNVVSPAQWRPAHLDQEDQVEFEVIDSTKRPCRCYVDSVDVGNVTRLLVRSSRVAGVTLAFSKSCDLQHKLYQMQFPKTL